jgi:hypothetical protein
MHFVHCEETRRLVSIFLKYWRYVSIFKYIDAMLLNLDPDIVRSGSRLHSTCSKQPFSIQSCRSCYARLYLCQRPFYKIFVKFRNSKKMYLKLF